MRFIVDPYQDPDDYLGDCTCDTGNTLTCAYFSDDSIFTLEKIEKHTLSSKKMHLIQQFITGNYLVDNNKVNDICKECDSYQICSHCFYVRNLLNKDKSRCLLVKKYNFQFEQKLKDLI